MRNSIAFVLVIMLAAVGCGKKSTTPGGDDDTMPDSSTVDPNGTPALEVVSKDIVIPAGDQQTWCYYFHTSNTTTALINKWVSDMTPGSHHAILFLAPGGNGTHADGTVDQTCNIGGQGTIWTYATQTLHQEEDLPSDDGTGKPLAQNIPANTAAFMQLHYLNATDNDLTVHIDLKGYALAAGATYTETDAYVTYNYDISIPAGAALGAAGTVWNASCPLPAGVKFWSMSTHSHKQSMTTKVMDGSGMVFEGTNWSDPGAKVWSAMPFYTFTTPNLTWECDYENDAPPPYCDTAGAPQDSCSNADVVVNQGQSAVTNEMCMATGYFFPATGPKFEVQIGGACHEI